VIFFFSIYLILLVALGPGVNSASTRSRKIMFLGSRVRPEHEADNLTAMREPIVYTMWDP
jgi:hypothetical protein